MNSQSLLTTCAYCGVGCGVSLPCGNNRSVAVAGDFQHPANYGKLCVKGAHLGAVLPLQDRLLYPSIAGQRVSWQQATITIAERIRQAQQRYGNDAFAFYLSGQLLTEDYYAANKLAKGYLGTANVDTNSRLCMSSAVAAHVRAFGEDVVPACYEDLELADCLVLVGSNLAWAHPVLFQRIEAARQQANTKKLVVVDPRKTATAAAADLHLAIKPGSDGQLFNALLVYLAQQDAIDGDYIRAHVSSYDAALQAAMSDVGENLSDQAKRLGVAAADLAAFFDWFASTEKTTTLWSMGINQSVSGVDKSNAIINVHLATGRLAKPGATAFSITGQPNAMGGREVGGLANQLAVHRGFDADSIRRVQNFWQAPNMANAPGLKAVDLFEACLTGKVKVLWVMGTNPVATLPDANRVKRALQQLDTLIVSDVISSNDTLALADIRLPALAWGEKDGMVTNSERTLSRQRGFLIAPGQARADWFAVAEVGKALGYTEAFNWHHAHEVFVEHARLTHINVDSPLQLDLSALADLSFRAYQNWQPAQWPPGQPQARRLFANGQFATVDGKARMVAVQPARPIGPAAAAFTLNTGRLRDQWHTMSRTGYASALTQHSREFELHINPTDADAAAIKTGDLVRVAAATGQFYALALRQPAQQPGELFAAMHWSGEFASHGGVANAIPSVVDPISGQPASKHATVRLHKTAYAAAGFYYARAGSERPSWLADTLYFKTHTQKGCLYKIYVHKLTLADWRAAAERSAEGGEYDESTQSGYWYWCLENRLSAWLTIATTAPEWPDIGFLDKATETLVTTIEPAAWVCGRPSAANNASKLVCTCLQVSEQQIKEYLHEHPNCALEQLQGALACGTNCGSCLSEVKQLIQSAHSC